MAVSPYKTWVDGETLTAADQNASFLQLTNAGMSLVSPATAPLDMNGLELILDADADSSLTADTDDRLDFRAGGVDVFIVDGTTASSVNGLTVVSSATGNKAQLKAHGSDTNIGITILPKGTGAILLDADPTGVGVDIDGAPLVLDADADSSLRETSDDVIALRLQGIDAFIFDGDAASAANGLTFTSAAAAGDVLITAQGSSTDVNVKISSKGSGVVKINSSTVTATPGAAAIPIADGSGTLNSWITAAAGTSLVLLNTYSPSSAASVDITSILSSTYDQYLITFALLPATDDVELYCRTDTSNGASFDTAASDYAYANVATNAAAGTSAVLSSNGTGAMRVANGSPNSIGNASGEGVSGDIRLTFRGSASLAPRFIWAAGFIDANVGTRFVDVKGGGQRNSAAAINAVQLLFSSGNIASGSVKIYGIKAS